MKDVPRIEPITTEDQNLLLKHTINPRCNDFSEKYGLLPKECPDFAAFLRYIEKFRYELIRVLIFPGEILTDLPALGEFFQNLICHTDVINVKSTAINHSLRRSRTASDYLYHDNGPGKGNRTQLGKIFPGGVIYFTRKMIEEN